MDLPEYACCIQYMHWFTDRPSNKVGVMIRNRADYEREVGAEPMRKLLLTLAIHGYPSFSMAKVVAAKSETRQRGQANPSNLIEEALAFS